MKKKQKQVVHLNLHLHITAMYTECKQELIKGSNSMPGHDCSGGIYGKGLVTM